MLVRTIFQHSYQNRKTIKHSDLSLQKSIVTKEGWRNPLTQNKS